MAPSSSLIQDGKPHTASPQANVSLNDGRSTLLTLEGRLQSRGPHRMLKFGELGRQGKMQWFESRCTMLDAKSS